MTFSTPVWAGPIRPVSSCPTIPLSPGLFRSLVAAIGYFLEFSLHNNPAEYIHLQTLTTSLSKLSFFSGTFVLHSCDTCTWKLCHRSKGGICSRTCRNTAHLGCDDALVQVLVCASTNTSFSLRCWPFRHRRCWAWEMNREGSGGVGRKWLDLSSPGCFTSEIINKKEKDRF